MTNSAFAELVGCDYTTASRYRNGKRLPSYAMLERIAAAFELDLGELAAVCSLGAPELGRFLRQRVFEATPAAA